MGFACGQVIAHQLGRRLRVSGESKINRSPICRNASGVKERSTMAQIPGKDRAAIKSDIALSRDRMGRELSGLRYELDLPRKLKNSFRHSPVVWISALGILGIIIAVAPARTKKVYVKPKLR